ncbi:MAG: DNA polymerase III subunit alpha [Pseudomonadota bacterium]
MLSPFIHLNLHTEYSIVDGIVRLKKLTKKLTDLAMPAVAITDQGNLFATVKLFNQCISAGIKPIIGADVWVKSDSHSGFRVILLCKNNQGYLNLKKLLSNSYLTGQDQNKAIISQPQLFELADGLIILLGKESSLGEHLLKQQPELLEQVVNDYINAFSRDNIYLEIQRTERENDETFVHLSTELAIKQKLAVVATNAVRFLEGGEGKQSDFLAHDTRVCVNQGYVLADKRRPKNYSEQQYLRSSEEMQELFKDIPEALSNTLEIAKRCNVTLQLGKNYLPDFPIPDGLTMDDYFRQLSHKGLEDRLKILLDDSAEDYPQQKQVYIDRLDVELDVIIQMGFPGYFLIVADFIHWSKENHVPVGPGRGSGAGSLVAYALTITDLDPLEYDLLFERFLNPERVSMPDFDIDFCTDGRDRVIEYVAQTYGKDRVSQIITYGSMAAKAAIRDVGRVQGQGYGFVDSIAKLIPMDIGITISKAMQQEEELQQRYDDEEEVRELIDMALSLEGITRNVGKHAGGVVISPSDINDFSPVYCEADGSNLVTQFDKDDVEAVGLVKFDFLGLKTLTVIDCALQMINEQQKTQNKSDIDITVVDLEDRKAFETLKASDTTAVFQLESRGMKELIEKLQPDCFEDIVALVALYRPGPLQSGMVDDFIERKHGRQKVEYPHPSLETILQPTYGTILYQEQVMQISQVLAGYSLGGADLLRRAMGKKKPEVMAQQRSIFEQGAVDNNVDKDVATHIFDQMEKFAAYGFNKSHSAAYALVSYQTLWLKTYFRAPFMASVLSADMDKTEKIVLVIEECREANVIVAVPDVNSSQYRFTVTMEQVIVYGLGAIKGVGEGAIESIVEQRENGKYLDFQDFCNRIDLRRVNRRVLETLVKAGALDNLGNSGNIKNNRATIFEAIPETIKAAEQFKHASQSGQTDLFGDSLFADSDQHSIVFKQRPEWDELQRLTYEKDALGLFLSGHPIDQFLPELKQITTHRISELNPEKKHHVVICGLLINNRVMTTKKGKKMAILTLDDRSGRQEIPLFAEMFEQYKDLLMVDSILIIAGELCIDNYSQRSRLNVEYLYNMDEARNRYAKRIELDFNYQTMPADFNNSFVELLRPYQNPEACKILINYQNKQAKCKVVLGNQYNISLSKESLDKLNNYCDKIKLIY